MAVKSIGLSKVGGRKPCTLFGAAQHNKRENAKELEARGRINPARTWQNYSVAGAIDAAEVMAKALQLMADIGKNPDKMRRDYCQAVEIVFSLPADTDIDTRSYFADCFAWCCKRFGADHILSVDVHLDESTPHCHALIAPIKSGRWMGCEVIDHANTKALNESFSKEVAFAYGLKIVERLKGKRKGDAVAMVLEHIENHDRELLQSPAWQPIRRDFEDDPAPYLTAYGLKLEDKPLAKQKTMTQIFTSPGKGAKREMLNLTKRNPIGIASSVNKPAQTNPIGIQNKGEKNQSLSCVGIPHFQNSIPPAFALQPERICVRKTELGSAFCDPATGEILEPLPKPKQHQRNS